MRTASDPNGLWVFPEGEPQRFVERGDFPAMLIRLLDLCLPEEREAVLREFGQECEETDAGDRQSDFIATR